MRDTQKIFRLAIYDLLNGNVIIDGEAVEVHDEKRKITGGKMLYIILGRQTESDDNTDDAFITDSSIEINIVHKTGFEVTKDIIDDISDQILQILIPFPTSDGWQLDGAQLTCLRRTSTITDSFTIDSNATIVAKIITLTAKIVQQFP